MPTFRRSPARGVSLVVAAVLALSWGGPAGAETVTQRDAVDDAPTGLDITAVSLANRTRMLVVRLTIDGLRPGHAWAHLELSPDDSDFTYELSTEAADGGRTVVLHRKNWAADLEPGDQVPSRRVRCDGIRAHASAVRHQLTLRVPQTCFRRDAGTMGLRAVAGDAEADTVDHASLRRRVRRGPVVRREPTPIRRQHASITWCSPRLERGDLALGGLQLRNESDGPIFIDSIALRRPVGLDLVRTDLMEIPRIDGSYLSYGVAAGYPPQFRHPQRRRAWRERRDVPGATIGPGERLDVVMHVRKTVAGVGRIEQRVVRYHDAAGSRFIWRDHVTVILRGRESYF